MAARSALPDSNPKASATLADSAKVVGWGLLFWGGVQLAANVFDRNATAAVAVQAALAEWGAGRIGVTWSDPLAPAPTWRAIGVRAARGAGLGVAAAAALVLVALATHAATRVPGPFTPALLAVGLVVAVLSAARDELLLRGVTLRATRGLLPVWARLLVCGAAAAGARWGLGGAIGLVLAGEALRGVVLAALWLRDRGGWMAIAANAGWTWVLGSAVRGGVFDVRAAIDLDAGVPAVVVLAVAAVAAAVWCTRAAEATAP